MINNFSDNQKRVMVAMSGGVDSSLTAALLLEQGYSVSAAYMKNWAESDDDLDCPWAQDVFDASQVAKQLNIDFQVFDLRRQYHDRVVDYMISEYQAGRTPNPDVMCNQEMKFGLFLELAQNHGADMIATGHYAQIINGKLFAGIDQNKDQSYFLYRIKGSAAQKSLMPVGSLTKTVVRAEAAKRNLFTATKKDSQGICFIGKVKMKDFLRRYVVTESGPIINQFNKVVGQHDGAIFYTIGQRSGMGVGGGLPYFVTGKDMASNTVFVTTDPIDSRLWQSKVVISNLHWISLPPPYDSSLQARVRYRGSLVNCRIETLERNSLLVTLSQNQRALALGQSVVLYRQNEVLGGGIIAQAYQS